MTQIEEAIKHHRRGDLAKAETLYLEILKNEPENSNTMNLLGVLLLQSGKLEEAKKHLERAVGLNPCAPFHENLGLVYFCEGDYYLAINSYSIAFAKEETFETLQQLVKCYDKIQSYDSALKYTLKLYETHPQNLDIIRDLAKFYNCTGDFHNAAKFYKKTLEMEPNDHVGLNNLGLVFERLSIPEGAKKCYKKSLFIKKNYEAYHNLGVLYRNERDFDKSIEYLTKALEIQPNNTESKISLGMTYLSKKDFQNGYKYYSQRNPELRSTYKNPWDGKAHPDSTLLIHFDGGHGDQVMFCRYIKYLTTMFKDVIFLVYPQLLELFKLNFPDLKVMLVTDKYDYDYSANVMELHYHLGMDFEHIPSSFSYLKADNLKIEEFKNKEFGGREKKVGLFWQGNSRVFKNRAIKLEKLKPLFDLSNTKFYSIQKEDNLKQIKNFPNIKDMESSIENFSDTAAIIANLDLLITIDSAVAHLGGALGVKTYLLLPYASEWRWFSETKYTPWYPCIEIFKQKAEGDWDSVVEEVVKAMS